MTTYNESFNQASSRVLGPDLTWTKFSVNDFDAGGPGNDDGHTVTIGVVASDSFDRVDSALTMGNTDSAFGGTLAAWTPLQGTWGVETNRAYLAASAGDGQCVTVIESGLSDCTVEITATIVGNGGQSWRVADNSNYWMLTLNGGAGGNVYKRVAGSFTSVASFTTPSNGAVVRVVLSGDDHNIFIDNVLVASVNDSFNNTETQHGLRDFGGSALRCDDFKVYGDVGDVAVGSYAVDGGDRTGISWFSDSFDRANTALSMGDTDGAEDIDGPETWFPAFGTWGISSNQAYNPAGTANAVTIIYTGETDLTVEATIAAGTDAGLAYRWFDNNNYWYTNKAGQVRKRVAGVASTVMTFSTGVVNDGDVVTVDLYGDLHTFYVNGVLAGSFTDSDFTGEVYHGLYANSSSNARFDDFRVYQKFAWDVAAFARAEHDTGSTSVYAAASIAAMQTSAPENYPAFFIGASLDTYAGPQIRGNQDAYSGPTGVWAVFEPLGWNPNCAIYAYIYNADAQEYLAITFTTFTTNGNYSEGPALTVNDVLRLDHDAANGYVSISVNGVEYAAGSYDLGGMTSPATLGERGGLGVQAYNYPVPYPVDSDRLDNFETGISSVVGPQIENADAERATAVGQAYSATVTAVDYIRPPTPCRWELYDVYDTTSFLFTVNPKAGGSPARKKTITSQATVAPRGKMLLFEGCDEPLEFEWSGIILTQDHLDTFAEWYEKNKQLLLTDDLGRQTYVYLTDFKPERAGTSHHPYRHTYTARAIELDWR